MSTRKVAFSRKYDPCINRNSFPNESTSRLAYSTRIIESSFPNFAREDVISTRGREREREREKLATTITFNESSTLVPSRVHVFSLCSRTFYDAWTIGENASRSLRGKRLIAPRQRDNASRKGDLRRALIRQSPGISL